MVIYKTLGPESEVSEDFWEALPTLFLRDLLNAVMEDVRIDGTKTRHAKLEWLKTYRTILLKL